MAKKRNVALMTAGLSTVGVGIGAWAGVRRAQSKLEQSRTAISQTLPVNSKWWRDAAKHDGELLYVAIGDSAAQGIGASAPKNSYVGVIADHIRSSTGRTVRVVNLSVSGATVALAVADQLPRFAELEPDIVTVAIGANDIAAFDPAMFEAGIRKVFAALPDDAVVADLPCFYLPWNEKKVAVGNRILRQVAAEQGLTIVPLHDTMQRQGIRGVVTQFAEDLFHPNDHGYRVWASAFLPAVTARVSKKFPRKPKATHVPKSAATPQAPAAPKAEAATESAQATA